MAGSGPGPAMAARSVTVTTRQVHSLEGDLRSSQDVQSMVEDLRQRVMLPGTSIAATWLREGPRAWPELKYSIQAKRSTRPLLLTSFTQLFPQQSEPRLHSCATSTLTLSTGSSALQEGVQGAVDALRALTSAFRGNTYKNQGQSLLNYQPKQRFQVF